MINALGADGVVKNLTLEDVTLKSKAAGSMDIGGIAATVNGKVSNCTVKGKFSHAYCNMGGIAGNVSKSGQETCEVRGCWTKDVLEYDQSAPVTP